MLWGALTAGAGGLLPTLARLAASFATDPGQPLPQWHILIALGIFFVLGAVIDLALNRGQDLRQAIMIGIAAPGLITNIVAGASAVAEPATTPVRHAAVRPVDVPAPVPAPQPGHRSLVVRVSLNGVPTAAAVEIAIAVEQRTSGQPRVLGRAAPGEDARFELPADATAIVATDAGLSATATLPPSGDVALEANVRIGTSGQGDLYWALGGPRVTTVTALDLKPADLPD